MRNIRIVVEYDGTRYFGFQDQGRADRPTIQAALEEAVRQTTGERVRVIGAGRTDAGVHALGQVANFVTQARIPVERIPFALNSRLPEDIAVVAADVVPAAFHARFWAKRKTYQYRWYTRPVPSPFWRRYAMHVPARLDVAAMRSAAVHFLGEHDFKAFQAAHSSAKSTVREIYRAEIGEEGETVTFTVEGSGFLYKMVRMMAGTLLEIGLGRRDPASVPQALATGDRRFVGSTLPAHGLTLVRVTYDEPFPEATEREVSVDRRWTGAIE